jgi:hypothetical protein
VHGAIDHGRGEHLVAEDLVQPAEVTTIEARSSRRATRAKSRLAVARSSVVVESAQRVRERLARVRCA